MKAKIFALLLLFLSTTAILFAQKTPEALLKEAEVKKNNGLLEDYFSLLYEAAKLYQADYKNEQSINLLEKISQASDEKPKIKILKAKAMQELGVIYSRMMETEKGVEYLKKALTIFEAIPDEWNEVAETYRFMAIAYFMAHQTERGLPLAHKALSIYEKKQVPQGTLEWFKIYNTLGAAYGTAMEFDKSTSYLQKALSNALQVLGTEHPSVASIYDNISKNYIDLNNADSALHYAEKALKINKKTGDDYLIGRNLLYIGQLYRHLKDHKRALEYLESAIPLLKKIFGDKHQELGLAYFDISKVYKQQGLDYLEQRLDYLDKAMLALLPRYEDKRTDPREVPSFYQELGLHYFYLLDVLNQKGDAYLDRYKLTKDIHDIETGVEYLDSMYIICERLAIEAFNKKDALSNLQFQFYALGTVVEACQTLYEHYNDSKYLEKALLYAERGKGFSMKLATISGEAMKFGEIPDSLVQLQTSLQQQLEDIALQKTEATLQKDLAKESALEQNASEVNRQYEALQQELEKNYPRYHKYRYQNQYVTIDQIKEKLINDTTLFIEFTIREKQLSVIGISKEKTTLQVIPYQVEEENQKLVEALCATLQSPESLKADSKKAYEEFAQISRNIYKAYLQKVLEEHPGKKRLLIVPDRDMNRIPFEVLLTADAPAYASANSFAKLPYLLQKYTVSYAYSATLLLENKSKAQKTAKKGILGFAASYDPKSTPKVLASRSSRVGTLRDKMQDLPGAKKEVEHLQSTYVGDYFFGKNATEKTFLAQKINEYSVLHLAMHGFLDNGSSLLSCLLFTDTGDSLPDNNLYVGEISQLNIDADLVVLSACETAVGKWERAEGVISLGRGFMYAGASSVLMTLWQINDEATTLMMQYFYANLAKGMPKDVALRAAKTKFLEKAEGIAAHPAFWAAFVLVGDESPIKIQQKSNAWYWWPIGGGVLVLLVWGALKLRKKE